MTLKPFVAALAVVGVSTTFVAGVQAQDSRESLLVSADWVAEHLNDDNLVDLADLATLGSVWGSQKGQPDFDPLYDLDGDGVIGEGDLELLSVHFAGAE